ncbi:hypothetical protein KL86DES1_21012 [uncultured Desulfovibrio sp.]|uniref:Uncharacterized protein n=1 Tax=uncultured Desulfovibrio sp. TaxID=167968 RepID=A0A212L6C5_9BACT|nr:hypothetical protein KL86DES1_21012 [uncultured Desulfovibrio sp.]
MRRNADEKPPGLEPVSEAAHARRPILLRAGLTLRPARASATVAGALFYAAIFAAPQKSPAWDANFILPLEHLTHFIRKLL